MLDSQSSEEVRRYRRKAFDFVTYQARQLLKESRINRLPIVAEHLAQLCGLEIIKEEIYLEARKLLMRIAAMLFKMIRVKPQAQGQAEGFPFYFHAFGERPEQCQPRDGVATCQDIGSESRELVGNAEQL